MFFIITRFVSILRAHGRAPLLLFVISAWLLTIARHECILLSNRKNTYAQWGRIMRPAIRLTCITLLALILIVSLAAADTGPLIINVDNRAGTSLDGQWNIIIDPYENGFYDYRYMESSSGYFRNAKPASPSALVEYDFDTADYLNVPGDWNSQRDDLFLYEGTVWYRRMFDYKASSSGKRLFVYFGAANYQAVVYLNGRKIGTHEGGFTPFNIEITDGVRETGNFLIVKVDNKRDRAYVPTVNTDWWNYGGLTRRVMLIETSETFVRDYMIQIDRNNPGMVTGWVQLDGARPQQRVTIDIPEAGISRSVTTGADGRGMISFPSDRLERWSPENPKLYTVRIAAETDTLTDEIGFRHITTRGTDILLNGESVFLRGICIHEESPFEGRRAFSEEDARTLLGWAKELNCNFVRLAHYPHNEYMARTADRMGILVWEEIPVYWTILWENETTFENASAQLGDMITRDKNRASVILWSMANETPISDARNEFLRRLAERARSLDSTRLLTAAMERHYTNDTTLLIDDPFGEYLDVLGCNEYIGWYDGLAEKADLLTWTSAYDKPVIMSELGGGALYGNHGGADERWTEEFQEDIYRHQVEMLAEIPFLRGTTPWILKDFRSPRRPLPGIQDFWNRKGLISDRGDRKKAFYVLQDFYNRLHTVE